MSSDKSDVSVVPAALTFSGTSWNTAQTATAEQDADARNDTATVRSQHRDHLRRCRPLVEFYHRQRLGETVQDDHELIVSPQAVTVVAKDALAMLTSPSDRVALLNTTGYVPTCRFVLLPASGSSRTASRSLLTAIPGVSSPSIVPVP